MATGKRIRNIFILATSLVVLLLIIKKENMSIRQSILKTFYPVLMATGRLFKSRNALLENNRKVPAAKSIYKLNAVANNGELYSLEQCRGKKLLIVNTASDCGYTGQFEELEELQRQFRDKLTILAFPANDFKEQEKGTDEEIANFCKMNYGISFPLMKKSRVLKGDQQNPVFKWLTEREQNGWNEEQPSWNFSKYLVDENGNLEAFFAPGISPLSEELKNKILK